MSLSVPQDIELIYGLGACITLHWFLGSHAPYNPVFVFLEVVRPDHLELPETLQNLRQ